MSTGSPRLRRRRDDPRPAGAGLLERGRELEAVAKLIAAAQEGAGGMLAIQGPAGIGKSRLLRVAAQQANGAGLLALSARGSESEQDFSFAVAMQLLERRLIAASAAERSELLAGAAALSLPLFKGHDWSVGGPSEGPDRVSQSGLLHGLFWLVANISEHSPLLLAIDDLHWCDPASVRFLQYLLQRLEELPVAVVIASRPAEGGPLVEGLVGHPLARRLAPAPLSLAAASQLLADALQQPVGERFAAAFHHATGGNPFLLQAMIQSLQEDRVGPQDGNAERIAELRPGVVRRQAMRRIAKLGERALAVASGAAVLGEDALLARVAAIAGLGLDEAAQAADALAAADIFAAAAPVRFAHPLLRAAVYEELPTAQRGRWHVRAARLLHEEHAPAEAVAAQLLHGTRVGEPWAVDSLLEAASSAFEAGSPESAIHYVDCALREPLRRAVRADALQQLARAKAMVGEAGADDDLGEALALLDEPEAQARALQTLGGVLYTRGDLEGAARSFKRALALLGDSAEQLARELHAAYFSAASLLPEQADQAIEHIQPLLERPPGSETPAEHGALAGAAMYLSVAGGRREQAITLANRAWAEGKLLAEEGPDGWAWSLITGALTWTGELRASLEVSAAVVEQARRRGSLMAYATASFCALQPSHLVGRLADAQAHAEAALDALRYGWRTYPAALAAAYAALLIDLAELDEAERQLEVLQDPGYGTPAGRLWALAARGQLRLAQGRPEEALADLFAAGEGFVPIFGENDMFTQWRNDAAVAAHQLGRDGEAQRLIEQSTTLAERTGNPTHRAEALRARARLVSAEEAIELLRQALAVLESSQAITARVRCLAELGSALRRSGRRAEARVRLGEALERAHGIGARRIEQRAREELRAAGARPRRLAFSGADALTASERRVAEMAAKGAANREIAQALFVTPRTVEQHLYNAYKKLGIKSRTELAGALGQQPA